MAIKCPKCKDGMMKVEVRSTQQLKEDYMKSGGTKLVCQKCGHRGNPSDIRQANKSIGSTIHGQRG